MVRVNPTTNTISTTRLHVADASTGSEFAAVIVCCISKWHRGAQDGEEQNVMTRRRNRFVMVGWGCHSMGTDAQLCLAPSGWHNTAKRLPSGMASLPVRGPELKRFQQHHCSNFSW